MEFPSQPDLWQLHDGENTFSQWGADKQGDWRPSDREDDCSLSGFNSGDNNSAPSSTPSEPDPQGDQLFPRNDFINRGSPQAVPGLPEAHSKIPCRKENIQLLASSDENGKAEAITRTPPVKRRRFGTLNIPKTTCLKQFEGDDIEQKSEVGKTNENPNKMPFWSFDKGAETTEKTEVEQNFYKEITEKFEFNSVLFGGVEESRRKKVCENEQNKKGQYSKSLEYQGYLEEMSISRRESQIGLVLTDSSHDSATNEILNDGSHHPSAYHMLVSLRTDGIDQYTEGKEKALAVDTKPAEVKNVCYDAGK